MKAYFVTPDNAMINGVESYNYAIEIAEIKNINPDFIFLFFLAEAYPLDFFGFNLFYQLIDWLEKNNKVITVIGGMRLSSSTSNLPKRIAKRIRHAKHPGNIYRWRSCQYEIEYERNKLGLPDSILKAKKAFTCYNHYPKIHRARMIDELAQFDLIKDGVITLHEPEKINDIDGSQYIWKYYDGKERLLEKYISLSDYKFIPPEYENGFFDIVTETQYVNDGWFISEKTLRPIIMCKPFLVLSSKGFHSFLVKSLGIQLYDELFDYSFDQCDDINDRITGIVNNTIRIRDLLSSPDEKIKMYSMIRPKLIHNMKVRDEIIKDLSRHLPKSFMNFMNNKHEIHGDHSMVQVMLELCHPI